MKIISWLFIFFLGACATDWSYSGSGSSQNWAEISESNKFCKIGYNQSPIDINLSMNKDFILNDLKFDYKISEIEKLNEKYYQKINFYSKSFVLRGKKKYWLKYIEFRHPSEHFLDSSPHSLEMQIYHKSEDEQWLAISYFLEIPSIKNNENLYFNNIKNASKFSAILSTIKDSTLFFFQSDSSDFSAEQIDTIQVYHTNELHFISVACGYQFYHQINKISFTKHVIDTIYLNNTNVNNDVNKEHLKIVLRK
jgi:hypothetical protein